MRVDEFKGAGTKVFDLSAKPTELWAYVIVDTSALSDSTFTIRCVDVDGKVVMLDTSPSIVVTPGTALALNLIEAIYAATSLWDDRIVGVIVEAVTGTIRYAETGVKATPVYTSNIQANGTPVSTSPLIAVGTTFGRIAGAVSATGGGGSSNILSIIPGTADVNLGKAEDAAHVSGDTGVFVLAVRKDTPAALAGTDGDYIPFITDSLGRLHTAPQTGQRARDFYDSLTSFTFPTLTSFTIGKSVISTAVNLCSAGGIGPQAIQLFVNVLTVAGAYKDESVAFHWLRMDYNHVNYCPALYGATPYTGTAMMYTAAETVLNRRIIREKFIGREYCWKDDVQTLNFECIIEHPGPCGALVITNKTSGAGVATIYAAYQEISTQVV